MVRHSSSVRSVADHSTEDTTDGSDTECGCVWNGYPMCSRLQTLARPHFFVVGLILIGLTQSISETYFTETVLSTGFSVPFSITRWLILGSEVAQLVIAIPIIYWGSTGRRPGWLAGLIIFLAVLCFLFGSEILTEQPAPVQSASYIFRFPYQDDPKLCQPTFGSLRLEKWNWYWFTIAVIPVLHLAIGLSRLGYWAFGIAYIDDNASDNMSPLLMGVAVALKQFGPFIGSFISSVTVTKLFNGISWLIIGGVLLLAAAISAMFPKILLGSRLHRSGDPGLISSLKRILSNRVIIYYGVAAILVQTVVINIFSIEKTYIESVFYIPSDSLFYTIFSFQYLFGILKPTVAAVALLVSGIIIYRVKPRALVLCLWSIISICIAAAAIFALIFLKCSAYPIYGGASRNNLLEVCNMNCGCSQSLSFTPACTAQFPYVFYSPCHAGCTTVENADSTVYTNCACVPTGTVDVGHCNGGACRIYWWLFQLFTLIATTSLASGFIGSLIICFRTILPTDKTVMVGIIFALSSFMARVPFKFLYDILTKWTCVYTVDSQCKFYDSDKLATFLNLFHICLLLAAAGLLSIACFMIQELQIYGNPPPPISKNINQEPAAEMTDFRSQLNQTLKARRESAAEEQKLLSDSSTQTRMRGYENGNRTSFAEDERQKSSALNSERKNTNIQKPLIPVKPPVLKDKINSTSTINSSTGSTPPASPAHSAGTTVQNQGYLTTLL